MLGILPTSIIINDNMSKRQKHTDKRLRNIVQLKQTFHTIPEPLKQNGMNRFWVITYNIYTHITFIVWLNITAWTYESSRNINGMDKCTWMRNNAWRRRLNNMSAMILLMLGNGCALHPETSKAKSAISCNREEHTQIPG